MRGATEDSADENREHGGNVERSADHGRTTDWRDGFRAGWQDATEAAYDHLLNLAEGLDQQIRERQVQAFGKHAGGLNDRRRQRAASFRAAAAALVKMREHRLPPPPSPHRHAALRSGVEG